MAFGRKKEEVIETVEDPTGWMLANSFAEFVLMHEIEVRYMCMLGYTFYLGCKVFAGFKPSDAFSYRIITMVMACTGGGIIVPILINGIPVPLTQDAYPIAIMSSFMIHWFFPVLREVMGLSLIFKACVIILYETLRSYVVVALTSAAGNAIPASTFSFPVFGPIMCGAIAGCGGAFLPLDKGLDPIKNGLAPNMLTSLIAATCYHLYLNLSISEGIVDAKQKAHVHVAAFFILSGLVNGLDFSSKKAEATPVKKES